jgi:hypothetical protein
MVGMTAVGVSEESVDDVVVGVSSIDVMTGSAVLDVSTVLLSDDIVNKADVSMLVVSVKSGSEDIEIVGAALVPEGTVDEDVALSLIVVGPTSGELTELCAFASELVTDGTVKSGLAVDVDMESETPRMPDMLVSEAVADRNVVKLLPIEVNIDSKEAEELEVMVSELMSADAVEMVLSMDVVVGLEMLKPHSAPERSTRVIDCDKFGPSWRIMFNSAGPVPVAANGP